MHHLLWPDTALLRHAGGPRCITCYGQTQHYYDMSVVLGASLVMARHSTITTCWWSYVHHLLWPDTALLRQAGGPRCITCYGQTQHYYDMPVVLGASLVMARHLIVLILPTVRVILTPNRPINTAIIPRTSSLRTYPVVYGN